MPSPFPGMDPYLEDSIEWSDLRFRLIGAISRQAAGESSATSGA